MKGNDISHGMDGPSKSKDKGESEEATVGIESDGRRKEIAEYKYKSQRMLGLFLYI